MSPLSSSERGLVGILTLVLVFAVAGVATYFAAVLLLTAVPG